MLRVTDGDALVCALRLPVAQTDAEGADEPLVVPLIAVLDVCEAEFDGTELDDAARDGVTLAEAVELRAEPVAAVVGSADDEPDDDAHAEDDAEKDASALAPLEMLCDIVGVSGSDLVALEAGLDVSETVAVPVACDDNDGDADSGALELRDGERESDAVTEPDGEPDSLNRMDKEASGEREAASVADCAMVAVSAPVPLRGPDTELDALTDSSGDGETEGE